jgi:hypothetical protein
VASLQQTDGDRIQRDIANNISVRVALASTVTSLHERCFLPRSSEMSAFGVVLF